MNDYGLSVRQLANAAGVTERTARRWRQRGVIPEPYQTALKLRLGADARLASATWAGWTFHADSLVSPEGICYTPGEIRATRLHQRAVEEYRLEISRRRDDAEFARELRARAVDVLDAVKHLIKTAQLLTAYLPEPGRSRPLPHAVKTGR